MTRSPRPHRWPRLGFIATGTLGCDANCTIAHNHPAGETCKPLARADVEKALADLRK